MLKFICKKIKYYVIQSIKTIQSSKTMQGTRHTLILNIPSY